MLKKAQIETRMQGETQTDKKKKKTALNRSEKESSFIFPSMREAYI